MKNIKKILFTLCFVLAIAGSYSMTAEAAGTMTIKSKVQSTNKIKLTWKKQKGVKGYKIYRETYGKVYKHELVAMLGKEKTSFVDKKVRANQQYDYTIYAYYYKNGKEKNKFKGSSGYVSTKIAKPTWDYHDGLYDDIIATPNKISISIGRYYAIDVDVLGEKSLKPDGIEVFKKVGKKYVSYKKIKLKKNKKMYYFTDKNVKPRKIYRYKFRTYKKIKGKTVYSKKTAAFPVCTINNKPSCDVKIVKPYNTQEKNIIVSITNNESYGSFDNFDVWGYDYISGKTYYQVDFEDAKTLVDNVVYSYDQVNWKKDIDNCKIQPGETVYFSLQEEGIYESELDYYNTEQFQVYFDYNDFYTVGVSLDPKTGKITMVNE